MIGAFERRVVRQLRRAAGLLVVAVWALASGCAAIDDYRVPKVDVAPVPPLAAVQLSTTMPPAPQLNGAIYQAATYRPFFEDHRARLPGDTLTIQIVEKITATAKSTSSVDKSGTASAQVTAVPFVKSASLLAKAGADGTSSNTFEGKGATESSNEFTGSITAVVTGVMPNGHLLIAGEKQIGVNANVDVLRFSGQVDPRVILPGNSVPSSQIANVRLEQRSRGQQGDAQTIGWLARFFLSVLPI